MTGPDSAPDAGHHTISTKSAGSGSTAFEEIGALYRRVGFRDDLVDDLAFVEALGICKVFLARIGGALIGVSSGLAFGATGWVGGMAVAPPYRNRGVATDLMRVTMAELRRGGASTLLLHSTPTARTLYLSLGFEPEAEMVELRGGPVRRGPARDAGPGWGPGPGPVQAGAPADLDAVLDLDRIATGEDRSTLLRRLWPDRGYVVREDGALRGYSLRPTVAAAGAVIAVRPEVGHALLSSCLDGDPAPARLAMPESQVGALPDSVASVYAEATRTTRMRLGPPVTWRPEQIFGAFNLYWG